MFHGAEGNARILIDPFLSRHPLATAKADELNSDCLGPQGLDDHVGNAVAIAKHTGATVSFNSEIHNWLTTQGVKNRHPQHIGGGFNYP